MDRDDNQKLLETLKRKTTLLLKRERELFAHRQLQSLTQAWHDVFKKLSAQLNHTNANDLMNQWANSLVATLGFQVAGVHQIDAAHRRLILNHAEPSSLLPRHIGIEDSLIAFLRDHRGGWSTPDDTSDLSAYSRATGLSRFYWQYVSLRHRDDLLLVAGYSKESARFRSLSEVDGNHFADLANHLAALMDNTTLITEVANERGDLKVANERLREEMEQRLRLEKELRHSQKLEALGHLAAGIGHEINNPLTYVLENLEHAVGLLQPIDAGGEGSRLAEIRETLAEARHGAERIRNIVGNVRVFSHPGEVPPCPVDVRKSLDAAIRMAGNELRHRTRLVKRIDAVPPVIADPHRLEQVFVNLLMNAVQALPVRRDRRNEIIVSVTPDGDDQVRISVKDNGHGISDERLQHVFEPFFTTRRVGKGSGLGLSICRSIVESFKGNIRLTSVPDKGTEAVVRLPAAGSLKTEDVESELAPPARSHMERPARILIIDDEPAVLRSLRRILSKHDTHLMQYGREAVDAYRRSPFDIVFCDLMMPDFSGIDFYDEMRELGPEHTRRIVFMTGGAFMPDTRQFLSDIDNTCLDKPIDTKAMHRLIEQHLSALATEE